MGTVNAMTARVLAGLALIVGLAIASAPAASADQWEYVSQLDNQGVYYPDVLSVINTGKATCQHLRNGLPIPGILAAMGEQLGYARQERAIIMWAAVTNMCPDQLGTVQAFVNG